MNHPYTNNQHQAQHHGIPADLAPIGAMLDRLGEVDRGSAPEGFEDRMASTTLFGLSASSRESRRARFFSIGVSRSTTRLAAALALAAAGVLIWSFRPHTNIRETGGTGTTLAQGTTAPADSTQGDDSEVFSMVVLALDGGTSSDIDYLLKDTSELDTRIRGASSTTDSTDGSTM